MSGLFIGWRLIKPTVEPKIASPQIKALNVNNVNITYEPKGIEAFRISGNEWKQRIQRCYVGAKELYLKTDDQFYFGVWADPVRKLVIVGHYDVKNPLDQDLAHNETNLTIRDLNRNYLKQEAYFINDSFLNNVRLKGEISYDKQYLILENKPNQYFNFMIARHWQIKQWPNEVLITFKKKLNMADITLKLPQ